MNRLVDAFLNNPVAANLLMAALLIGGLRAAQTLPVEGFPKLPPSRLAVSVVVPGASPRDVERTVTGRLERALEGVPGIARHRSVSTAGFAEVQVEKRSGADLDRVFEAVKAKVEAVPLPATAERPLVRRETFTLGALYVQVYLHRGDADAETLDGAAQRVRRALLEHPSISRLSSFGARPRELRVELDLTAMRERGITGEEVLAALQSEAEVLPEGVLQTTRGRISLRSDLDGRGPRAWSKVVVRADPGGGQVRVGDVARIVEGFGESELEARFRGAPSIGFEVLTSDKGDLRAVAKATREVLSEVRGQLPAGVKVEAWGDMSVYIEARLGLLRSSAVQGLLLVFVVLAAFLDFRLAFWVAMGIPTAIAGTLAVLSPWGLDQSLNDISSFGLIIVLGVLVDDAVVVGESVFEEKARLGADPVQATRRGVHRVALATVFGVLTTVAAFLPLSFLPSDLGRIFGSFASVVIAAILFSLIESKLILPAHLRHVSVGASPSRLRRALDIFPRALVWARERLYRPALAAALRHRAATLLAFVAFGLLGVGLVLKGQVRTVFFPQIPGDVISVSVRTAPDAAPEVVKAILLEVERGVEAVNSGFGDVLEAQPIQRVMTARLGATEIVAYGELRPAETREVDTLEVARRWRAAIGRPEGLASLDVSATEEVGGGFELGLSAPDPERLAAAAQRVMAAARALPGVLDVRSDLEARQPELRLRLSDAARAGGLQSSDFRQALAVHYGGAEVARLARDDGREAKLRVVLPGAERDARADLEHAAFPGQDGRWRSLGQLTVRPQEGQALQYVAHRDGRPSISVYARVDSAVTTEPEVFAALQQGVLTGLKEEVPGLRVEANGALREQAELESGLKTALLVALLAIYALLAVPLRSYGVPLVIMSVVPFGFAGAIFGHHILGLPLSLLSLLGMLALAGVVVNDSLVLATRFRELMEGGRSRRDAAMAAGLTRFRAIFLTTATTCIGLAPLMLETSEQARYLIPAAASLAFGELFATGVTLVLVPLLLSFGADRAGDTHEASLAS